MNITVNPQYIKQNVEENIEIVWDSVETAEKYTLERKTNGKVFVTIYEGTELSYTDNISKTINATEIEYRVKATLPTPEIPEEELPEETETAEVTEGETDGDTGTEETPEETEPIITEVYSPTITLPVVSFWVENDILYPYNFLINYTQSEIPSLPEISEETQSVSGKDGDISLSTRYMPRPFNFFGYSPQFETNEERDNHISYVSKILNTIKEKEKYLLYRNKIYKIKLSAMPIFNKLPLWYDVTIYQKAHNPYGYSLDKSEVKVTANEVYVVENNADDEAYPNIIVNVACSSPKFIVNGVEYITDSNFTMTDNDVLEIDCERSTAILNKGTDREENAMKYFLSDTFPAFEVGENTVSADVDCEFVWRERSVVI